MHGRVPRLVLAAALAAALAVTVTAAGGGGPAPSGAPALTAVSSRADGGISTVLIEATEPVAYVTSQPDPLTVLVDLRNVRAAGVGGATGRLVPPFAAVALEETVAADGAPVTRVRVSLARAAEHRVHSSRNRIYVDVDADRAPGAAEPASRTSAAPAGAPAAAAAVRASELTSLTVSEVAGGAALTIRGNGRLVARRVEKARDLPPRVLLDFDDVARGDVAAVTPVGAAGIEQVRVATNSLSPLVTRVVVDLAHTLAYTVEEAGDGLRVFFGGDGADATATDATATDATDGTDGTRGIRGTEGTRGTAGTAGTPAPEASALLTGQLASAGDSVSGAQAAGDTAGSAPAILSPADITPAAGAPGFSQAPGTLTQTTEPAAPTASAPSASSGPASPSMSSVPSVSSVSSVAPVAQDVTPPAQAGTRFTGSPVTLDFQGADLRAVLRTFAEISGLNIVIDPTINGSVDVSLREVPWDQALDIILKANKLGYTVDGTIVRIAPLQVLAQEEEERRKLSEAQALAGQLEVLARPLSYARAQELVQIVTRSALSERGEVQVDTRTNTLIIRDLPDRLSSAEQLIATLDKPQPQVEIEARIVRVRHESARELGILWGVQGRVSPELGNTTGLAFPNTGSIEGRTGGTQGPDNTGTAVNLKTQNPPTGAIGLSLGSVNGAFNLDVALQALEDQGKLRLLSAPRVSTQNNLEAEIYQGTQIPIQTVANNTVTVTFKDAALTLRVTPQITASQTVIMRIVLEKAQADFSRSVNGIPPIDTQRANTNVLLADGETTVIGGIFESQEISGQSSVPFLSKIPLLGWLFKNSTQSDFQDELMIFITPRIIKG